nr:hypothetical protein [Novosphingobium sp. ERN07]
MDSCLSERLVEALNSLYGHQGFEFLHVSKFVPAKTRDEHWADVYATFNGKIVISGDCKIAYRPHEAVAFIDNGFVCFFPEKGWGQLRGHEQAAILIHQWPRMVQWVRENNAPCCWRFDFAGKSGGIRLSDEPFQRLEIPEEVLETTPRRLAKRS